MNKVLRTVFIGLGFLSIIFAVFDFFMEQNIFDGLLSMAWGLLFLFFAVKQNLASQLSARSIKILQFASIIFVFITGILKLMYRLNLFDGIT